MLKINVIKRNFFQQSTPDNCGAACLAMLLSYAGKDEEAVTVSHYEAPGEGFSLLDLKEISESVNIKCRCVEMDVEFLKKLKSPAILHTVNDVGQFHFIVCYGFDFCRNAFLIADPAIGVHHISKKELLTKWVSKAALYTENLQYDNNSKPKPAIFQLLRFRAYPAGLLLAVPLLSLCIASFGVALTWLLQKGLNSPDIFKSNVIVKLVFLLFIICIFKNLFSFLRQFILIKINLSTNRMLVGQMLTRILSIKGRQTRRPNLEVTNALIDVQKIQNAISALIAVVLSDGAMVLILIASSFYLSLYAGLLNLAFALTVICLEIKNMPEQIYQTGKTRVLSAASEKALIDCVERANFKPRSNAEILSFKKFYNVNLEVANKLAIVITKRNLLLECLGTINLITVICIEVHQLILKQSDYESFMLVVVEAYLITVIMQKICISFQQIFEGAEASISHSRL